MLLVKGTGLGKQGLPRRLVNKLITVARRMRSASTPAEKRLWHHIRERQLSGYKFRRQGKRAVGFAKIIYDQQPLQLLFRIRDCHVRFRRKAAQMLLLAMTTGRSILRPIPR